MRPMRCVAALVALVVVAPGFGQSTRILEAGAPVLASAVSIHPDGTLAVAWAEVLGDFDIRTYYQRFDSAWNSLGPRLTLRQGFAVLDLHVEPDLLGNDLVYLHDHVPFPHGSTQQIARGVSSSGELLWDWAWFGASGIYGNSSHVSIVASPGGGWHAAWSQNQFFNPPAVSEMYFQRIEIQTGPSPKKVTLSENLADSRPVLSRLGDRFLAVWRHAGAADPGSTLLRQVLSSSGVPESAPTVLRSYPGVGELPDYLSASSFSQSGAWLTMDGVSADPVGTLEGIRLASGAQIGGPTVLASGQFDGEPSLGVDSIGRGALAWAAREGDERQLRLSQFSPSGASLAPVVNLATVHGGGSSRARVAASPSGEWAVVWPADYDDPLGPGVYGLLGHFPDGCSPGAQSLCLAGNRFRVTATYHDHLGRDGVGQANQLTAESGSFWFFAPESLELFVKVVDACTHPDFQNFWVFASGLTDVAVTLSVVDTWAGETWERETELGVPFPSTLDTSAFDTCGTTAPISSVPKFGR
jgi:hypothetical protein